MRLGRTWVVSWACVGALGCAQATPLGEPSGSEDPTAQPAAEERGAAARLVPFARIEGYGNPATGELWMRTVPSGEPAPAIEHGGVRGVSAALAGYRDVEVPVADIEGSFEFYTEPGTDTFDHTTCFNTLPMEMREGAQGTIHSSLFGSVGALCFLQKVGNHTNRDFSRVLIDIVDFYGNQVAHAPYGAPYTPATARTPRGRGAPDENLGLWDVGPIASGEEKSLWVYFKHGDQTDFRFTGYLVGEISEECGDGDDDDGDGIADNGCHTQGPGQDCFADDDCATGLYCGGERIVSRMGASDGQGLDDDVPGNCRPNCPRGTAGPGCNQPTWAHSAGLGSGVEHACAITSIGTVKCWGDPIASGVPNPAFAADGLNVNLGGWWATALAVGARTNCVIVGDGTVRCWGDNSDQVARGEAGPNVPAAEFDPPVPTVPVWDQVDDHAVQVAIGNGHACALRADGGVRCWGKNTEGQCGTGDVTSPRAAANASDVPLGGNARQICTGDRHSCALLDDGRVRCWGDNSSGQLGYGHTARIGDDEAVDSVPAVQYLSYAEFLEGRVAAMVACGGDATCVVLDDGTLRCWGANQQNQLGYEHTQNVGDDEQPFEAGAIDAGGAVTQVTIAASVTCAVLAEGGAKCWGRTVDAGCLGQGGSCDDPITPSSIGTIDFGDSPTENIVLGHRSSSDTPCARFADGSIKCWGDNGQRATGTGSSDDVVDPPSTVATIPHDTAGESCITSACSPGNVCTNGVCMHDGELRFVLSWSANTDFDLHVQAPNAQIIHAGEDRGAGGLLDVAGDGTPADGQHVEQIFFLHAMHGDYQIWVENAGGTTGGDFSITVFERGAVRATFDGTLPATGSYPDPAFVHSFPTPIPPIVLGQQDYESNGTGNDADQLYQPQGVAIDPITRHLYVADSGNNRVLRFASVDALMNGDPAEAVFGQTSFGTSGFGYANWQMQWPRGLFVDDQHRLWVADHDNHRVLRFDDAHLAENGAAAALVLGQPGFGSPVPGTSANEMNSPTAVLLDPAGQLWVADTGNNRVLRFDAATFLADGVAATGVLGQASFTASAPDTSSTGMNYPTGLAMHGGHLWVAEVFNHRVVRFDNAAQKGIGAAADVVLGQATFDDSNSGTSSTQLFNPVDVLCTPFGALAVSDYRNNRILAWDDATAVTTGQAADHVLGQDDSFDTGAPGLAEDHFNSPTQTAYDPLQNRLWITDTNNNRVMGYSVQ